MTKETGPKPVAKRPLLKLLILVAIFVAIVAGCLFQFVIRPALRQKAAVLRIQELDGVVLYYHKTVRGVRYTYIRPHIPDERKLLDKWIACDLLDQVDGIQLNGKQGPSDKAVPPTRQQMLEMIPLIREVKMKPSVKGEIENVQIIMNPNADDALVDTFCSELPQLTIAARGGKVRRLRVRYATP